MAEQSFQNHRKLVPYFLAAGLILMLNAVWWARELWRDPGYGTALAFAVAIALVTLAVQLRGFALTVQDRVIRLEMQIRLQRLLTGDLAKQIPAFTVAQLVALRFASDAELPELAARVLHDNMKDRTAIKQMIKHWQADDLRA